MSRSALTTQGRTAAEDDVLAVQPGRDDGGDEELRPIGVLPAVRHRQHARLVVLQRERLILRNRAAIRLYAASPKLSSCTLLLVVTVHCSL